MSTASSYNISNKSLSQEDYTKLKNMVEVEYRSILNRKQANKENTIHYQQNIQTKSLEETNVRKIGVE